MRRALWPECGVEDQLCEIADILGRLGDQAVFVAVRPSGSLGGFLEISLRSSAAGCRTSKVGYVEGWYVDPDVRREGTGQMLMDAAEAWSRGRGCLEMASDATVENHASIAAHLALGFREVERSVNFHKQLSPIARGDVADGSGI